MTAFLPGKRDDELIGRKALAEALLLSTKTLYRWALQEKGPSPIRIGERRVAYRVGDVRSWLTNSGFGSGTAH